MKESSPLTESKPQKRARILRRLSSAVAVVAAGAITVSFISSVYSVPEQVQAQPYDGVTLYRALFFASGPVASKIPTIRKAAPYLPAEYKRLEGQTIKYIREKDPNFFDRFAKEIQSGDRVRVADALKSTSKLQRDALLEVTKNSNTKFALQVRQLRDGSISRRAEPDEPENDANVAVEVVVWIVLAVLVAIVFVAGKVPGELKGLRFEQHVDEIVRAVPRARPDVIKP